MKNTLSTFAVTLLAASLAAQDSLTTASGYAVYAHVGPLSTPGDVVGVPAGTDITRSGLHIRAFAGSNTGTIPSAMASAHARLAPLSTSADGRTVVVDELGHAIPAPARPAVAGTSDDPRTGDPAPHGLAWVVPAPAGTTGVVAVSWTAAASIGAYQTAAVDADGDGRPDFAERVSNGSVQHAVSFRVRAGTGGFAIGIVTEAHAGANVSVATATGSRYDGRLEVSLRIVPGCSFTNFGPECAGRLDGVLPGPNHPMLALELTRARPHVPAVLVLGQRLRTPIPLPGSPCELHVGPLATVPGQTNGQGAARWTFPPLAAAATLTISFQVVTVDLAGDPIFGTSNGTTLICP